MFVICRFVNINCKPRLVVFIEKVDVCKIKQSSFNSQTCVYFLKYPQRH